MVPATAAIDRAPAYLADMRAHQAAGKLQGRAELPELLNAVLASQRASLEAGAFDQPRRRDDTEHRDENQGCDGASCDGASHDGRLLFKVGMVAPSTM
jgi:hypothetical protein